mgnify:FL=1
MVERRKVNQLSQSSINTKGPRLNVELETIDVGSIDLNIFEISKRNTRMNTFVRLSQRFVADNLQALP